MTYTFAGAIVFDADISKWDVSSVTDMTHVFAGATVVGADISKWDVSSATDTTRMFAGAPAFNADISVTSSLACHRVRRQLVLALRTRAAWLVAWVKSV